MIVVCFWAEEEKGSASLDTNKRAFLWVSDAFYIS